MGKNKHSKDRLFITATEWATEYGGKKHASRSGQSRPLPFDHCALSLAPFQTPALLPNGVGVVFELENIEKYLQKHGCDPVTGQQMTTADIIRLNMAKNADGLWECPVTNKVFTPSSHIVAIRTTGNVYSFDAVNELNIKAKNFTDLIDGTPFTRQDIITLHNPQNAEDMARRDISQFVHLHQVRQDAVEARKTESKLRHTAASEGVMKEIERVRAAEQESGVKRKTTEEILRGNPESNAPDVARFLALHPTAEDVTPGMVTTDGRASASFTSSTVHAWTNNATRLATAEEIRAARWKIFRKLGKKGYVQLQTSFGNINVEVHCDQAPMTAWNFLSLCKAGYYNETVFHRLVPGFVVQGGDPTGKGTGGHSAFPTKHFADEFDNRLLHNARGVLSMANSGQHTNGSQFFITLAPATHLDFKHPVFAKVVGGMAVLDRIEAVGSGKNESPREEVRIQAVAVFSDPLEEADDMLEAEIKARMSRRQAAGTNTALPTSSSGNTPSGEGSGSTVPSTKRVKL